MNELFGSEVQVKSPRLRWMEKYGVRVRDGIKVGNTGRHRFMADNDSPNESFEESVERTGFGETEDDALAAWARKNNVRLWNEE